MSDRPFSTPEESALAERYVSQGYVVLPVEDAKALGRIRDRMVELAQQRLKLSSVGGGQAFLDAIGDRLAPADLNEFRLAMIAGINAETWLRPAYYNLARQALAQIVGNELAMQRRINLSIQLPADDSSLLAAHTDTWSGDSPFEAVLWVPLVDCHDTKAMFLLPPALNAEASIRLAEFGTVEALFAMVEKDLVYIPVPYGSFLLFNQNLIHGNRVNREKTARWSFNCRFKGLFTPYADKRLGEFFEPISMKPQTRIGLAYRPPTGFE